MTNERHEKALEAAVTAFYGGDDFCPNDLDRSFIARAISAYVSSMGSVIVPRVADSEMQNRGVEICRTHNLNDFSVESRMARIFSGILEVAPNHFTNGE